jgi:hypothetical protein
VCGSTGWALDDVIGIPHLCAMRALQLVGVWVLAGCASAPATTSTAPIEDTTAVASEQPSAAAGTATAAADVEPPASSVPAFPSKEPLRAVLRGVPVTEGKVAFLQNADASWSFDFSGAYAIVTLRLPRAPEPGKAITGEAIRSGIYTDAEGKNRQSKSSFTVSVEVDKPLPPCPKKRAKDEWTEVGKVTGRVLVEIDEPDQPAKSFVSGAFEASVKCPPP